MLTHLASSTVSTLGTTRDEGKAGADRIQERSSSAKPLDMEFTRTATSDTPKSVPLPSTFTIVSLAISCKQQISSSLCR
ncbi:hypothetical protein EB796_009014 [Bugula neritina]|uniref:Uncharacterized protein n=1 Tax=Bugula neritina TaxID=10212 RepID=A0A7J7K395_BUGNE|nr:hypothetical protein EB796_009014 [Bugula neritina]